VEYVSDTPATTWRIGKTNIIHGPPFSIPIQYQKTKKESHAIQKKTARITEWWYQLRVMRRVSPSSATSTLGGVGTDPRAAGGVSETGVTIGPAKLNTSLQ
jgi:hypothetical protein